MRFNASMIVVVGSAQSGSGVITRTTEQFSGFKPAAITRNTISFLYI